MLNQYKNFVEDARTFNFFSLIKNLENKLSYVTFQVKNNLTFGSTIIFVVNSVLP